MDEPTSVSADTFVLGASGVRAGDAAGPMPPGLPMVRRRSGLVRMAVGAAAFLVASVGGFLGWRLLFGGFSFPGEIAGVERVDSGFVDGMVETMQAAAEREAGVSIDMAVYGNAFLPQYVMFTVEISDSDTLAELAASGLPQAPPIVDLSGSEIGCAPNPDGSACAWLDGDKLVGLGGMSTTPDQLRSIALDLKG
jgi:hypothetical protein